MAKASREAALRAYCYQSGKALMEQLGLSMLSEEKPVDDRSVVGPRAEYEAMTSQGRLALSVMDDGIFTRLDLSHEKINFMTFTSLYHRNQTNADIDHVLNDARSKLEMMSARLMERTIVTMSIAEVAAVGQEAIRQRVAFGEDIRIPDFDQAAKAREMADFSIEKGDTPVIADFVYSGMTERCPTEAYFASLRLDIVKAEIAKLGMVPVTGPAPKVVAKARMRMN